MCTCCVYSKVNGIHVKEILVNNNNNKNSNNNDNDNINNVPVCVSLCVRSFGCDFPQQVGPRSRRQCWEPWSLPSLGPSSGQRSKLASGLVLEGFKVLRL